MPYVRLVLLLIFAGLPAGAEERDAYLGMARQGWSYELRTTMIGRDMSIPVRINGRDMAGAALCVVGEAPGPDTRVVLDAFRGLIGEIFGKPMPMRFAGRTARACGAGRVVVLRLYSGRPPNRALSEDIDWMNGAFGLGLPSGRDYAAMSPAMAQTFFGHRGQVTHIMVKQSGPTRPGTLERAFYKSILVEELFQSFTFGMDVLKFDRDAAFLSKLQEFPMNMGRMPWSSRGFMRAILGSNPQGLCRFDVFMLYAVAGAPGAQTNTPEFIEYIAADYDRLRALAEARFGDARHDAILDPDCAAATFPRQSGSD
ncbi:MAG: hypothetical protein ACE369_03205 [Roseovarius sp.]